jgi:hypothetical protein
MPLSPHEASSAIPFQLMTGTSPCKTPSSNMILQYHQQSKFMIFLSISLHFFHIFFSSARHSRLPGHRRFIGRSSPRHCRWQRGSQQLRWQQPAALAGGPQTEGRGHLQLSQNKWCKRGSMMIYVCCVISCNMFNVISINLGTGLS